MSFIPSHKYTLINHTQQIKDNGQYSLLLRLPTINSIIQNHIENKTIKEILGTQETLALYRDYDILKTHIDCPQKYWSDYCNQKHPKKPKNIIMITGTNGKTSTCSYIAQILTKLNQSNLLISSLGIYRNQIKIDETVNSTPDADIIHQHLNNFTQDTNHTSYAVIETTSIGIAEYRTHNIHANIALCTNVTDDHFDYHKNKKNYLNTKLKLGQQADKFLIHHSVDQNQYPKYGDELIDYTYDPIKKHSNIKYKLNNKIHKITTRLPGKFNAENILTAILALKHFFPLEEILPHIKTLTTANGRLNIYQNFIIDYAHTVNGVQQIIDTAKELYTGKIFVVIGFGGGSNLRRKQISKFLKNNADFVIFTMDNPRYENPMEIALEAKSHCPKATIELNRELAIQKAYNLANSNDAILILGKGAEEYMKINDLKIPYSDKDIILKTLKQQTTKTNIIK